MFVSNILAFLFPPMCVHCHQEGDWLCAAAWRSLRATPPLFDPITVPNVERVLCVGSYDQPELAALIGSLKYAGWSAVEEVLPTLLDSLVCELPKEAVITPLPLHRKRQRERGFNQAEVIARALAKASGLPMQRLLQRTKSTKQQAKLNEAERAENVRGVFALEKNTPTLPSVVVLVDDVITTGSTIGAAANTLRLAGTTTIIVICLAKG